MADPSLALHAAIRAMHGACDPIAVSTACRDWHLARFLALAPGVHPVIRALAAYTSYLPATMDAHACADPAIHGDVQRMIDSPNGRAVLAAWAHTAPAGWGAAISADLITAVQQGRCDAAAAAALIGPDDRSAALLTIPATIAFAIRRWGESGPTPPTAWIHALSQPQWNRLATAVQPDPYACAMVLPWLPLDAALQMTVSDDMLGVALAAFARAALCAQQAHVVRGQRLVERAQRTHLAALTRLACVMQTDDVWQRVGTLLDDHPDAARDVVVAAPWDALSGDVHTVILAHTAESDICAAVAAARGQRDPVTMDITEESAAAFFAALDTAVWSALDAATRQRWLHALTNRDAHLAVRSIGLCPAVLVQADLDSALVDATQRHAPDAAALRWALLPKTLRDLPPAAAHALITAMPSMPRDPVAFFIIASGRGDEIVHANASAGLRTPADLAVGVTLQRSGKCVRVRDACALLQHALSERTWDDLAAIVPLLNDDARAAVCPDVDGIVVRLIHPNQRDALHPALQRQASLPPAVALPITLALARLSAKRVDVQDAAEAVADALRAHGDVFLSIVDALADDGLRAAVLPLPEDAALADALRVLVRDDPVGGRALACALHARHGRPALLALLHAPPHPAGAVWQALAETVRHAIVGDLPAETTECAALAVHDPLAALALAALHADDADLRTAGGAALTARCARIRAIWEDLPLAVRHDLGALPAFADLMQSLTRSAIQRGTRRGRA